MPDRISKIYEEQKSPAGIVKIKSFCNYNTPLSF
jgi:hypothetical protein